MRENRIRTRSLGTAYYQPLARLAVTLALLAVFGLTLMTAGSMTTGEPSACFGPGRANLPLDHCRPNGFPGVGAILLGFLFAAPGVVGFIVVCFHWLSTQLIGED